VNAGKVQKDMRGIDQGMNNCVLRAKITKSPKIVGKNQKKKEY